MSDTMLLGVLRMPPTLWLDSDLDRLQRFGRYLEAADRIERDRAKIDAAIELLRGLGCDDLELLTGTHRFRCQELLDLIRC